MRTFSNPVYARSFPDPFVLKHDGTYWGFCTGRAPDGRCFGVATSTDLVRWEPRAGAMQPLPGEAPCYWAPEVVRVGDTFILYYSVGDEDAMQIRAAVAAQPGGPYQDAGRRLTHETFAIDPHVFEDEDGRRWLFYATDFLEHTHVGTGTVRDRLLDPFTLEGKPQAVTRPHHAWQVYDPQRREKGGVRWHTVEGPFVLKRRGVYYEMFSGGNWKNVTYGVSYATARSLETQGEWAQHADGERVLPILRTIPGRVIGPGHNSVVRGPDGRELFCVYHRWSQETEERVLCIDRLDWAGDRLLVAGPTDAPQPAPLPPTRTLRPRRGDVLPLPTPAWLLDWTAGAPAHLALRARGATVWECRLEPGPLRLELNGRTVRLRLADEGVRWAGEIESVPDALLFEEVGAESEARLTVGFDDVFGEREAFTLEALGWRAITGRWSVGAEGLSCEGPGEIVKEMDVAAAEVVLSARAQQRGGFGLLLRSSGEAAELRIAAEGAGWRLDGPGLGRPMPRAFVGTDFQQLRLRGDGIAARLAWERAHLATLPPLPGLWRLHLRAHGEGAVFDAVRVTAVPEEGRE